MQNARAFVWLAATLLAAAGCSHASRPSPSAAKPHPRASSAAGAPSQQPSPELSAPPAAAASASPSSRPLAPLPLAAKRVPRVAPDAPPQILDVAVSQTTVQPGDRVIGRVVTSSNVASVEARIGGYAVNLAKVGVGRFQLTYTVAPLPWFIRGNFTMQVIARNTRGDVVTRAIPLTVR